MDFTLPANKTQMYQTLQELFHYYRIERQAYEPIVMNPLELERMTFTPSTNSQLTAKATTLLKAEQEKRIINEVAEKNAQISKNASMIGSINENYPNAVEEVEELYEESENKIRDEAVKKGFANTNIVLDKIAEIEAKKNEKLADMLVEKNNKLTALRLENASLSDEITSLTQNNTTISGYEISAKVIELKEAEDKIAREIEKYNNSLDEREQRSLNNIAEVNANLLVKYLEIKSAFFTKDQLVDMGYYADVISCVSGYYDTLTPSSAYHDIVNEHKLITYLDDYYESVVYMYRVRSGE